MRNSRGSYPQTGVGISLPELTPWLQDWNHLWTSPSGKPLLSPPKLGLSDEDRGHSQHPEHGFWKLGLYGCRAWAVLKPLCCELPETLVSLPRTELGPEGPTPEADLSLEFKYSGLFGQQLKWA